MNSLHTGRIWLLLVLVFAVLLQSITLVDAGGPKGVRTRRKRHLRILHKHKGEATLEPTTEPTFTKQVLDDIAEEQRKAKEKEDEEELEAEETAEDEEMKAVEKEAEDKENNNDGDEDGDDEFDDFYPDDGTGDGSDGSDGDSQGGDDNGRANADETAIPTISLTDSPTIQTIDSATNSPTLQPTAETTAVSLAKEQTTVEPTPQMTLSPTLAPSMPVLSAEEEGEPPVEEPASNTTQSYVVLLDPFDMKTTMTGDVNEEGFMEVLVSYMESTMAEDFDSFQSITYGVSTFSQTTEVPPAEARTTTGPITNVTVHIHLMTATFSGEPDVPDAVVVDYMEMLLENPAKLQEYIDSQPELDATIHAVELEFEEVVSPTDVQQSQTEAQEEKANDDSGGTNVGLIAGVTVGCFVTLVWMVYLWGLQTRPHA